ncbi:bifunctional diguanylate cyclase/phosphodiesterase [uncultured Cellulomonas sp.]|uniref:putative bifunctional diguanylate cyclase/phosphodiesterase n=1 Tax=uncultured Cellulomonas sp. TaxID=189682 RepID=UPI002614BAF9|nr:EAL domain-containing protein [uncultured Cellulomonas sp.]
MTEQSRARHRGGVVLPDVRRGRTGSAGAVPAPFGPADGPAALAAPVGTGPVDAAAAETSGATTALIVKHVRARGGRAALDRMLELAQVSATVEELEDLGRWSSYDCRIRLFEAATVVLDDPLCTRQMGSEALRAGLAPPLVLVLRAIGSPAGVYRQMPRAVPKFTTTSTMEMLDARAARATVRYRLHDGYEHSRLDCLYAQGLMSVVPELFGLPQAKVVHDECQSDGVDACLYHLTWTRRRRPWTRRPATAVDPELAALRGQIEELQSAATDLVRTEDLNALLHRITERAAAAVIAPSYLLALHDPDGGEPLVHSRGISEDRARELARRLLAGGGLGESAVVAEVASSRRRYGHLAALHGNGQRGPEEDAVLLSAYAGHAAAALDLLTALEASRRGESRSTALLTLAHDLRSATEPATVAQVVSDAIVRIVGCASSSVFTWDERDGRLRVAASAGLDDAQRAAVHACVLGPETSPEVAALLTRHEPCLLTPETAAPTVAALLRQMGLADVMVAPLVAGEEFLGVATASWQAPSALTGVAERLDRLGGVVEFAATAMQNARLLGTVRHQSLHDALTQLPNRVLFNQRLDAALQRPGAVGTVAVLFCDLDRFKQVNDALGHAAGDELLRQAAGRLRAAVRPSDLVARLSGDEFAVLLDGLSTHEEAAQVAETVVSRLAAPFRVDGLDLRVTTSVGVAVHHGQDAAAPSLLQAADGAMYVAKQHGRNQVSVAGRAATAPDVGHTDVERALRCAADNGELRLHFQRLVDIGDPAPVHPDRMPTVGVEALLRWQHPTLGLLAPAAFLSLAEEIGVVVELDLWAVREACRTLAEWDAGCRGARLHVAVNTSARTLVDPRLHATVREALAANGLAPSRLYLEVVESRSLVDLPGVADRLSALRRIGVGVSLDDFGTGYSTLAWLQRLPVDQIKLDRSFTSAITEDGKSLALATGVLALARELGVEVVTEGVETVEQLTLLREAGFTLAQGYLFGRPQPGAAIAARAQARHREG